MLYKKYMQINDPEMSSTLLSRQFTLPSCKDFTHFKISRSASVKPKIRDHNKDNA